MKNWDGEEKRRSPRYPINKSVQLKLQDDLERHLIHHYGYGKNIGLGGIYVKLLRYRDVKCHEIKEGAKIQVKIPAWDTKQYLELIGQVVWCSQDEKGSKMGIQFLSNDNKGKEVLLFQLVEGVRKRASGDKNNVRIIKNADLARGKVICRERLTKIPSEDNNGI